METFSTLYKRDTKGVTRVWWLELQEDSYRSVSGTLHGVMTHSGWTVCSAKRGTTAETQAQAEVEAHYKKKLKTGYFENYQDIGKLHYTKPMLAETYDPDKVQFPCFAQPKLDGIRCIARADGLWTRTGKPITAVPHIFEALQSTFDDDPDLVLDGELYNHDLKEDFGKLVSLIRKKEPVPEAKSVVQYHVYDIASSEKTVGDRLHFIAEVEMMVQDCIVMVNSVWVENEKYLNSLFQKWTEQGYEGQMVRVIGSLYENKRSKNLLKRKDFITEEFPVVGVYEGNGNWSGCVKEFKVELPSGLTCDTGVRGSQEKLKALLNASKVPTWATVRYFGYTPKGMLRFPVTIDWGFGKERED
jgi:DNA ligase-1